MYGRFFMIRIRDYLSLIPGFIYKYLERIVHQKDINDFLAVHGDKYGLDFAVRPSMILMLTVTMKGEENLPSNESVYFRLKSSSGRF